MVEQKTLSSQLCVLVLPFFLLITSIITISGCGGRRNSNSASAPGMTGDPTAAVEQSSSGEENGVALADLATEEPPAPDLTDGPRDAFAQISGVPPLGAAGGPAYSSFYKSAMAFDGTPRTWWAGERNKATWDLYYGLPAAISLTKLTINFYSSQYTPTGLKLYTSADGTTWTQSGNVSNPTSKPSFTLANISAKYIRIEMTGNPPTGIPIIREIDWLPAAYKPGASAGPNYNDDWYFAANAFDNNPGTWWAGKANAGAWDVYYNFGSPRQVTLLSAAFYNASTRPATVTLYTSGDGITWTKTGDLGSEATSTIYVGAAVLYMKLAMTGNPPSTYPLIKDIYFDALPGAASPDSYSAFYSANKAFDNKPATLWAGKKAATEWNIYYTFPAPTAVTNVAIHYTDAAHTPAASDLYTSGDGITWTNTATFSSGAEASAWAGVTVKYLRFKLTPAATATASFFPTIKDIDIGGSTAAPSVQLKSPDGAVLPNINTGDDVYFGMTGLVPGAMYDINVKYPNGASYTLNLSANEKGVIPSSSVLTYDAGLPLDPADPGSGRLAGRMGGSMAGREALLLPGESIKVIVKKGVTTVTNFTVPYITNGTKPSAYTSNSAGYLRNAFVCANNEDIYVAFRQFTTGEKVRVYIVPDRIKWKYGDRINDVSGGYEEFTLPTSDNFLGTPYNIWTNSGGTCAPLGKYDIIVERGTLDGFIDEGDIIDSQTTVGFMAQGAPSNADIIEQIATDENYTYKNIYSPNETIYVYMNPKIRSRVLESFSANGAVKKYVTHHKAVWNAGDSIIDQTAGIEGDIVQWGCWNESLIAVWPAPLADGDYDIVIDANKNGVYDPGIDFLDNIDENGNPNYGFHVQPAPPPCTPQCIDDSKCEDGNQDTINTCKSPGMCNSTCTSYKTSCDLTVDKVNYIPEQTIQITLTGRNESSEDKICAVEIALKRDKLTPVWNSLNDNIFITIPAGTEIVRKITKFIPSTWAGTDSRDGSDYAIYTVRADKTRWDKGDNFNAHVKWECPISCLNANECNDNNPTTIDSCTNSATCSSTCMHSACPIACTSGAGCDDGNPLTTDACINAGTCASSCSNTLCAPACSNDTQCNDSNPLTFDTCDLMGTCSAACAHTAACTPACTSDAQCADALTATYDVCENKGTCDAACKNCVPACKTDLACDDSNPSTMDTCANPGTCNAVCNHCPNPICRYDTGCEEGNYLTRDTCNNPGSCIATCSHAACTPACTSDTQCSDGDPATPDKCILANTCDAVCSHYQYPEVKKISSALDNTYVLDRTGGIKCWGKSACGQPYMGSISQMTTPRSMPGISNAVFLSNSGLNACALMDSGQVKCWGWNYYGQLGDGTKTDSNLPVSVVGITNAVAIASDAHTCALMSGGGVKCWGSNNGGQLGNGTNIDSAIPVNVSGITNAVAVTVGASHTCALIANGSVKCWGTNARGELGDGTNSHSSVPVTVTGINNAKAVSAGVFVSCALLADGVVKCWGANTFGQIGIGTYVNSSVPVSVAGINNAVNIDHNGWSACAVIADGSVKSWGVTNGGSLGDGTYNGSSTPVNVLNIKTAKQCDAGYAHSCALLEDDSIKCWGNNNYGQLGNGNTIMSNVPVSVLSFP